MGEKETATSGEAERLQKQKTKSNQSNDRTGTEIGDPLDPDSDDDRVGGSDPAISAEAQQVLKNKTKSNQSNDRTGTETGGTLDPDSDDDGVGGDSDPGISAEPQQVQKAKTKSNQSNDRIDPDSDGDELDPAINNTKSNIKNLTDDGGGSAAKLAPERPVRSEIAVGDEGVPADKPTPKSK